MSSQDLPRSKTTRPARPRPSRSQGAEARYRDLLEQLPVGVYRTTPDGGIVEANTVLALMLGFEKTRDLLSHNVKDFYIREEDRSEHISKLSSEPTAIEEYQLKRADGKRLWVRDHSRRVTGRDGSTSHYEGILVDITERKATERRLEQTLRKLRLTNEKLEELSLTDHLTGLNNRRGFYSFGLQQMKIAKRIKKDNYLIFLDIDRLKEVNDTYGHPVGDLLLKGVAFILRTTLRESDVIGRIGGDEFAILAMRSKGQGERGLPARIEEGVRTFRLQDHPKLRLSVSMGLVRIDPQKYQQLDDFLAHADFLMYQEKRKKERQGTTL